MTPDERASELESDLEFLDTQPFAPSTTAPADRAAVAYHIQTDALWAPFRTLNSPRGTRVLPLAWLAHWGAHGARDPLAAAWDASRWPYLLRELGVEWAPDPQRAFGLVYSANAALAVPGARRDEAAFCEAYRAALPRPPPLAAFLARLRARP